MGDDNVRTDETLSQSVKQGTRALVVAQVISQAISLAALGFLFRRLGPEPFGLLGMIMPALLLARMIAGFGLQESVVQAAKLDSVERDRVFWMNQFAGVGAAIVMIAASLLLAWLFDSRELLPIGAALACTLPLTSLSNVHQGYLQRGMRIAALANARVAAQLVGAGTACLLAWGRLGVWSLVGQQWVELGVLAALLWWQCDWKPTWRKPKLHRASFAFGGWYTASSFFFYWAQNVDKYLLAWLLGSTTAGRVALGMYNQAFNLAMKPVHLLGTPATSIALPTLSRLRDTPIRFARFSTDLFACLAAILFPAAAGIALVAHDLLWTLGGGRWLSAAPMLIAFTPLVAAQGLINVCGSIFASRGNAKLLCWGAVGQACTLTAASAAIIALADKYQWTPQVSAISLALAVGATTGALIAVPYLVYCAQVHSLRWTEWARSWAHTALACVVMVAAVRAFRGLVAERWPPAGTLVAAAVVGAGVYVAIVFRAWLAAWKRWRDLKEI